ALARRLAGAAIAIGALLESPVAALGGVGEPLRRQRQVALQPLGFELRLAQLAFHLRAARLGSVTLAHARLPPAFRFLEARAGAGRAFRQLARAHAQGAERQIEILELAPYQRDGDPEALVDHLFVALCLAALARETADLRLHFGDQILEPREIGGRLLEA